MKRKRNLLIKVLFFLVFFLSIDTGLHSNFVILQYSAEVLFVTNSLEDSFSPDLNFLSENQIDQQQKFVLSAEPKYQFQITYDCTIFNNFCLSIWQPPKFL
jgi:uncharacterized protein YcfL